MTTATAEATETGEKKSKARTFKPDSTPRQRVLSESLAKFVKKSAPKLHDAAERVRSDPGFEHLSADVKELVVSLLAEISEKNESTQPVNDKQTSIDL